MVRILAVDPGTDKSAMVTYDGKAVYVVGLWPNEQVRKFLTASCSNERLAVEMIASYGMPVGREVFETCVWIGRFVEAFAPGCAHEAAQVYRKDVKLHLCGNPRAKDSNIRQALIDRFGPGKAKAVGTKKAPGPLYGVRTHLWAALAVAVYAHDKLSSVKTDPRGKKRACEK